MPIDRAKNRKANAIPGGGGCWIGGPKTVTSGNYGTSRAGLTYGAGHKAEGEIDETSVKILDGGSGTSIFDPVLAELLISWFSPNGGLIIDPFAGGSVRGIVAAKLGRGYIGVDLRAEQIAANKAQWQALVDKRIINSTLSQAAIEPLWLTGDSMSIDELCKNHKADFIFSCPPYADLEVYSDDPLDLSTMNYADFKAFYFDIIKKTTALLKPDSFAAFVVGECRDSKGNYYNFVGDTIEAFNQAGLNYYNEMILITMVGSLPIRAGRSFNASRKIGKTHQNILVFVKGDGKKAAKRCGLVEVTDFDDIY